MRDVISLSESVPITHLDAHYIDQVFMTERVGEEPLSSSFSGAAMRRSVCLFTEPGRAFCVYRTAPWAQDHKNHAMTSGRYR
jgi:hypothetical protein